MRASAACKERRESSRLSGELMLDNICGVAAAAAAAVGGTAEERRGKVVFWLHHLGWPFLRNT